MSERIAAGELTSGRGHAIMSLPAKVLYEIASKTAVRLLLNRPYHTIEFRPSVVTLAPALTLAGSDDPQSDTGGRNLLNPWHLTGPPKTKRPPGIGPMDF